MQREPLTPQVEQTGFLVSANIKNPSSHVGNQPRLPPPTSVFFLLVYRNQWHFLGVILKADTPDHFYVGKFFSQMFLINRSNSHTSTVQIRRTAILAGRSPIPDNLGDKSVWSYSWEGTLNSCRNRRYLCGGGGDNYRDTEMIQIPSIMTEETPKTSWRTLSVQFFTWHSRPWFHIIQIFIHKNPCNSIQLKKLDLSPRGNWTRTQWVKCNSDYSFQKVLCKTAVNQVDGNWVNM